MSTLYFLSEDFQNVALEDIGVSVTITHLAEQTFDPDTGAFTDTSDSQTVEGVLGRVTKQDLQVHPDVLKISDQALWIDEGDLSWEVQKGDSIQIGSNVYLVIHYYELDDLIKFFIRKH